MSIVLCNTKNNNLFLLRSPRADTETKNLVSQVGDSNTYDQKGDGDIEETYIQCANSPSIL